MHIWPTTAFKFCFNLQPCIVLHCIAGIHEAYEYSLALYLRYNLRAVSKKLKLEVGRFVQEIVRENTSGTNGIAVQDWSGWKLQGALATTRPVSLGSKKFTCGGSIGPRLMSRLLRDQPQLLPHLFIYRFCMAEALNARTLRRDLISRGF